MTETAMTIHQLRTLSEMEDVEAIQSTIFGYGREAQSPLPYPARCLFEFAESGGLVLGAKSSTDELLGFSAAWIGREQGNGGLYLHSQLLGVLQSVRDRGIGYELKMHQKRWASESGIPVIKWTFDPLQARNAFFNFSKLGATSNSFVPNYFGNLGGLQNGGFPTDRLWIRWDTSKSGHTSRPLDIHTLPSATILRTEGHMTTCDLDLSITSPRFTIAIPLDASSLRTTSPHNFSLWQRQLSSVLTHYLPAYTITAAFRDNSTLVYCLERTSE